MSVASLYPRWRVSFNDAVDDVNELLIPFELVIDARGRAGQPGIRVACKFPWVFADKKHTSTKDVPIDDWELMRMAKMKDGRDRGYSKAWDAVESYKSRLDVLKPARSKNVCCSNRKHGFYGGRNVLRKGCLRLEVLDCNHRLDQRYGTTERLAANLPA
jgi:hypothetical protein